MSDREDAIMKKLKFSEINLLDPFFDSLRGDYAGFASWFKGKSNEYALATFDDSNGVNGFLYLKQERGPVTDISPILNFRECLKVGTFKIDAHGTKLGERFVKKIFDYALERKIKTIYVTIFPKHEQLISLLKTFGFYEFGKKTSGAGVENVYVKEIKPSGSNDIIGKFPYIETSNHNKYLLSIYPEYHTKLFPDSILRTEEPSIVEDLSPTNSIRKIYISKARNASNLEAGDIIVIYRTGERGKLAEYSAVATSVCVVEEIKNKSDFDNENCFMSYCSGRTVFSQEELSILYRNNFTLIKLTYNLALKKRIIRKKLIEEAGLSRDKRWTLIPLEDAQFKNILDLGEVDESIIFN